MLVFAFGVGADSLKQELPIAFGGAKAKGSQITTAALLEPSFFYAEARSKSGSHQRSSFANRAVTIDATDLDRSPRLVIKNAIAVGVLAKVAINALHALL